MKTMSEVEAMIERLGKLQSYYREDGFAEAERRMGRLINALRWVSGDDGILETAIAAEESMIEE